MQNENILLNTNTSFKRDLDTALRGNLGKKIKNQCVDVDEIDPTSTSLIKDNYIKQNRPFIIRGAIRRWPAYSKWDFDFFSSQHGKTQVTSNLYNVTQSNVCSLSEFIQTMLNRRGVDPSYLQEWWFAQSCPELCEDIIIPDCFSSDQNKALLGYSNFTLWMGQEGAHTPIHQDSVYTNVWSAQIRGEKEWVLFDKSCKIYCNVNGKPDYNQFIREHRSKIFHCTLTPGDILYVPYKWWHQATTQSDAISLNTFYVSDEICSQYLKDIISIPLAAALNKSLLEQYDPMRYNICVNRAKMFAEFMGFDPDNILSIDLSGDARSGIYATQKAA